MNYNQGETNFFNSSPALVMKPSQTIPNIYKTTDDMNRHLSMYAHKVLPVHEN